MKRARQTFGLSLGLVLAAVLTAGLFPGLGLAAPADTEFVIVLDETAHATYGLAYPGTYSFSFPAGSTGLRAEYRYRPTEPWNELPTRESGELFNGVAAARFDAASGLAFLSATFGRTSDNLYLRVVDTQGLPVPISYQGMPQYYDNRRAAVTVTLDDVSVIYEAADFDDAVRLLRTKGIHHTVGIITAQMDARLWGIVQGWVDAGYTEASSMALTHPCTDQDYRSRYGYALELRGSRDDILTYLQLPAPYVPAFLEPCGFTSTPVRREVIAARYLVDRGTDSGVNTFSAWGSDGAYVQTGLSYDTWSWPESRGTLHQRDEANRAFDEAYAEGGIYHLQDHPFKKLWWAGSPLDQHAKYVSGRSDVWYVAFGDLYQYHYLQERNQLTVAPVDGDTPTATAAVGSVHLGGCRQRTW